MNLYTTLLTKDFTKNLPTKNQAEYVDNLVKLATSESKFTSISIELLDLLAQETNVTTAQILGRSRLRPICDARHIIAGLLRESGRYSSTFIGKSLGRNHATILHSVKRCNNLVEVDKAFRTKYNRCKARLISKGFLEPTLSKLEY